jgi:oxygen-independent coproporphyrinogen-3 oxidase
VQKCPYCDFNSHGLRGTLPEAAYIEALIRDLDQDLPRVAGREIQTLFFGGGTPSLFSAEAIARFLAALRARLAVAVDAEISLEANPGTVERGRFAEYRAAGVTRLSIGVQSFNPPHLRVLGRIHSSDEAARAAEEAHAAGLGNFNLDLMYGLPEQSLEQAQEDIRRAQALDPAHISHYQLTLEPNTLFHAQPPQLPEEDLIWDMQRACQQQLADAGYAQYEISAYAQPGRQCRHNLNYWRFGDYLGIGAGAHGKLTDPAGRVTRVWKVKHPETYLQTAGTPAGIGADSASLGADLAFEFMLNRSRLVEPFTLRDFELVTGLAPSALDTGLEKARSLGLLQDAGGAWQVTSKGHTYLNDLQALFLPEAVSA